ncbi:hypothetical protein RI367_000576 [Sorochytrium milnesiophthora]
MQTLGRSSSAAAAATTPARAESPNAAPMAKDVVVLDAIIAKYQQKLNQEVQTRTAAQSYINVAKDKRSRKDAERQIEFSNKRIEVLSSELYLFLKKHSEIKESMHASQIALLNSKLREAQQEAKQARTAPTMVQTGTITTPSLTHIDLPQTTATTFPRNIRRSSLRASTTTAAAAAAAAGGLAGARQSFAQLPNDSFLSMQTQDTDSTVRAYSTLPHPSVLSVLPAPTDLSPIPSKQAKRRSTIGPSTLPARRSSHFISTLPPPPSMPDMSTLPSSIAPMPPTSSFVSTNAPRPECPPSPKETFASLALTDTVDVSAIDLPPRSAAAAVADAPAVVEHSRTSYVAILEQLIDAKSLHERLHQLFHSNAVVHVEREAAYTEQVWQVETRLSDVMHELAEVMRLTSQLAALQMDMGKYPVSLSRRHSDHGHDFKMLFVTLQYVMIMLMHEQERLHIRESPCTLAAYADRLLSFLGNLPPAGGPRASPPDALFAHQVQYEPPASPVQVPIFNSLRRVSHEQGASSSMHPRQAEHVNKLEANLQHVTRERDMLSERTAALENRVHAQDTQLLDCQFELDVLKKQLRREREQREERALPTDSSAAGDATVQKLESQVADMAQQLVALRTKNAELVELKAVADLQMQESQVLLAMFTQRNKESVEKIDSLTKLVAELEQQNAVHKPSTAANTDSAFSHSGGDNESESERLQDLRAAHERALERLVSTEEEMITLRNDRERLTRENERLQTQMQRQSLEARRILAPAAMSAVLTAASVSLRARPPQSPASTTAASSSASSTVLPAQSSTPIEGQLAELSAQVTDLTRKHNQDEGRIRVLEAKERELTTQKRLQSVRFEEERKALMALIDTDRREVLERENEELRSKVKNMEELFFA